MRDENYIPKFEAVVNLVTQKIKSGEWVPGHKLPSQAEWKDVYSIDYGTLRAAYLILKAQKLIRSRQGEGVYVAEQAD